MARVTASLHYTKRNRISRYGKKSSYKNTASECSKMRIACVQMRTRPLRDAFDAVSRGLLTLYLV